MNFRTGEPVDAATMGRMCDLLAHRGPDGAGVWTEGHVGFGHRRLAVIDPSAAGAQPMRDRTGSTVLTFNGEIYNFAELGRELEQRGHRLATRTDTEVLLTAYREWGVDCLARLRGMFAFAIWDGTRQRLLLARDRLGKKPLHYRLDDDGLAFASEPKAFLADPGFTAAADPAALSVYLTYQYVPSPRSAFAGVHRLPPAHYLLVEQGRVRVERYWRLSYAYKRPIDETEAVEALRAELDDAVRVRLVSDVPLGAFLSGGVDSGSIVALMARQGGVVRTFSIGFEEDTHDELPLARLVAERYATRHHEFVVRPDAVQILPELVWHYGEPFADSSAVPSYYLAALARRHVTVALNGDAGDENFAGYRRYVLPPAARVFDQLPGAVRAAARGLTRGMPGAGASTSVLARTTRRLEGIVAAPAARYQRRVMMMRPEVKAALCEPEFLAASDPSADAFVAAAYDSSDATEAIEAKLDTDIRYYLPDCLLVKVDIATMAHGLEARSPMLDHRFMEFAASLPATLKLRGTRTKHLLKQAARDWLPSEIVDRPKRGFGLPLEQWFRRGFESLTEEYLLDRRAATRGIVRPAAVARLVDEHRRGQARWHNELWTLVMLEAWHRMFIDRRPEGPPARQVPVVVEAR